MGKDSPTLDAGSDVALSPSSRTDKAGIRAAEDDETAKFPIADLSAPAVSDVGEFMRRYGL